jgi:hypothetical protein
MDTIYCIQCREEGLPGGRNICEFCAAAYDVVGYQAVNTTADVVSAVAAMFNIMSNRMRKEGSA